MRSPIRFVRPDRASLSATAAVLLLLLGCASVKVSDRGHMGERDPWQTEGGKHTRRVLDALNIQHDELRSREECETKVAKAMTLAQSSLSPVALLLTRDLMWEEPPA